MIRKSPPHSDPQQCKTWMSPLSPSSPTMSCHQQNNTFLHFTSCYSSTHPTQAMKLPPPCLPSAKTTLITSIITARNAIQQSVATNSTNHSLQRNSPAINEENSKRTSHELVDQVGGAKMELSHWLCKESTMQLTNEMMTKAAEFNSRECLQGKVSFYRWTKLAMGEHDSCFM